MFSVIAAKILGEAMTSIIEYDTEVLLYLYELWKDMKYFFINLPSKILLQLMIRKTG